MPRTPGKWSCMSVRGRLWDITSESGDLVAGWLSRDDAEHIVRVVNCHDGLVNLAKTFRSVADDGKHEGMVKLIDAILEQAEGRE